MPPIERIPSCREHCKNLSSNNKSTNIKKRKSSKLQTAMRNLKKSVPAWRSYSDSVDEKLDYLEIINGAINHIENLQYVLRIRNKIAESPVDAEITEKQFTRTSEENSSLNGHKDDSLHSTTEMNSDNLNTINKIAHSRQPLAHICSSDNSPKVSSIINSTYVKETISRNSTPKWL